MKINNIIEKLIRRYLPDSLYVSIYKSGWYGCFDSWEKAKEASVGYNSECITEKVKSSLLKVKNNEAVYERDSVLFDHIQYSWEILSILMWIAAQNKGELNLIDFGGSMGSTYYQNRLFLNQLHKVQWNIVEQPEYVKEGINNFQDETLRFYQTIGDCCVNSKANIQTILFSSVLQYLEAPYNILNDAIQKKIEYILIDRTGFTLDGTERITIQKVPSQIYEASYPCRFFSEKEFLSYFDRKGYDCVVDFNALDKTNINTKYKGFIFKRGRDV